METSQYSLKRKGDGMVTSPLYLKGKGDGIATFLTSLMDGYLSTLSQDGAPGNRLEIQRESFRNPKHIPFENQGESFRIPKGKSLEIQGKFFR